MKHLFTFLIVLPFLANAQTGEKNFIDQPYIEVTGKAEMEIIPDEIYLKIILSEKDNKGKTSLDVLEKAMKAKLQELGIDIAKDLAVKDLMSNFKSYLLSKTDILLTKGFQLLVHDAATAGRVFMELEKISISNLSIERLEHSKIEQFRREVKINAITVAKDKAEALTTAIGQNIGKALNIVELENYAYNYYLSNVQGAQYSSRNPQDNPETNVDFEKIKLEYSILIRFELK